MANLETLPYYLYSMEINETAQAAPRCKVSQGRDDKNANKSDETETAQKRWDKGLGSSEEESPKHTRTRSQDLDDQAKFLVRYVSRFGSTVKTNKKFTWL